MKKETLVVPAGIRYMSDWAEMEGGYRLEDYKFPHIVNKQITGCGFTEYCLRNNLNIILCSPRKILLENKEDQHRNEVFLFRTTIAGESLYDKDLNSQRQKKQKELTDAEKKVIEEQTESVVHSLHENIRNFWEECRSNNKPCKFLVTYDSFRHIREALRTNKKDRLTGKLSDEKVDTIKENFIVVIDEFQSVFTDSRFKSSTEIEFLSQLEGLDNVCFVSATPMLDKYLDMLEEFKNLPYYEFDWSKKDPGRVIHPRISVQYSPSITKCANNIIEKYKSGNFDKYSYVDKSNRIIEIESREAVLYFNSVSKICEIIKKNGLTQEECNVLCANTTENENAVRKAFGVRKKNFQGISKVPKYGEPHKMFTLCTRTVYLGADFYSTNAQTFVFSDSNVDCLAVDISLDLPQILGRQRLNENPWKNSATLYFKSTSDVNKKTKEDFDKFLQEKLKATSDLLEIYEGVKNKEKRATLLSKFETAIKYENYKKDFVAINHHKESSEAVPVFNNLVMVSEMRAFDIQQVDYKDRFSVFNSVSQHTSTNPEEIILSTYVDNLKHFKTFIEKLKYICHLGETLSKEEMDFILMQIPTPFDNYYRVLGPARCRSLSYQRDRVMAEYDRVVNNQGVDIGSIILDSFELDINYSRPFIKEKLAEIYAANNYKKTAKASDICEYFNTVSCDILTDEGKRQSGFKLISKKE